MKIISKPDYTAWTYKFTCWTCKSELQADHNDLKYRTVKQWYGGRDFDEGYEADVDYYYVVCPVCSKETGLIPNEKGVNISYLLQEKVKKDYNEGNKKARH